MISIACLGGRMVLLRFQNTFTMVCIFLSPLEPTLSKISEKIQPLRPAAVPPKTALPRGKIVLHFLNFCAPVSL
jgi:hypothetical protein